LTLLPATLAAWLYAADLRVRIGTVTALAALVLLPLWIAVRRVRRLIAAGHRRADLVGALENARGWRLEELAFVYGNGPTRFERALARLCRVGVVVAAAAVLVPVHGNTLPWQAAAAAGAIAPARHDRAALRPNRHTGSVVALE
jgi:hypothetical protein